MSVQQARQIAMTEAEETSSPPASANQSTSVGSVLRAAREGMGLSVNDVANRIKFAPKQIESLEADDLGQLPEAAFVRGFVRSYARLVGLDPLQMLSRLPGSHTQTASHPVFRSVDVPMPTAMTARRHNIIWLAVAFVIAVALAIFERSQDRTADKPVQDEKLLVQPLELPVVPAVGSKEVPAVSQEKAAAIAQPAPAVTASEPVKVTQPAPVAMAPVPAPSPAVTPALPVVSKQMTMAAAKEADAAKKPVAQVRPVSNGILPFAWQMAAPATQKSKPADEAHTARSKRQSDKDKKLNVAATEKQPKPKAVTENAAGAKPGAETSKNSGGEAVAAEEHALRIEFEQDAWVEIRDIAGNPLVAREHTAGSLIRFSGKPPLDIRIGNPGAVRMFDNGRKINLSRYTSGEVAHIYLK